MNNLLIYPVNLKLPRALFLRVSSLAFLAANLALAAIRPFSTIFLATEGFSQECFQTVSKNGSVIVLTSLFPSFVFVCPSNCGSGCLIEIIAVSPSRTSSPENWCHFFKNAVFPCIVINNPC